MTEWWDYKVVEEHIAANGLQKVLEQLGRDGWELVTCERKDNAGYYLLIFKMRRAS